MSLKTWKAEFYPVPASRVSKKDALAHSMKKWEGALKKNLRRHGVQYADYTVFENVTDEVWFCGSTCALCVHYLPHGYRPDCPGCPLDAIGECCVRHDKSTAYDRSGNDARPMVRALRAAMP